MKSKRLIIIGLIVSILLVFSGCGTEKIQKRRIIRLSPTITLNHRRKITQKNKGGSDMEKIKLILLTIVYFIVIVFIINKLINFLLPWNFLTDVFTLWCWGIAVIVSTGLAQYTLRKVREL